jgi:hypothetical protein
MIALLRRGPQHGIQSSESPDLKHDQEFVAEGLLENAMTP